MSWRRKSSACCGSEPESFWPVPLSFVPALQGIEARFAERTAIVYGAGCVFYLLAVSFHYVSQPRKLRTKLSARHANQHPGTRRGVESPESSDQSAFLFNSLNSISALTSIDPVRARDMCVLLGDFLRLTLGLGEKTSVRLSEELELLQKYYGH